MVKIYTRRIFLFLFTLSLLVTVWANGLTGSFSLATEDVTAQSTDVGQLVQRGVDRYEAGSFLEAIDLWETARGVYKETQDLPALATVSENLARAYQQLGRPSQALSYWEEAIAVTNGISRSGVVEGDGTLGRLLTEQAQAYSQLGQPRRAIAILCGSYDNDCVEGSALQIAKTAEDATTQVAALGSLGEAYRLLGNERTAIERLKQGLELSQNNSPQLESAILNGLGTVYLRQADIEYRRANEASAQEISSAAKKFQRQAEEDTEQAIAYLQESYDIAIAQQDESIQLCTLINIIPAEARIGQFASAQQHKTTAIALANRLPDSQVKAYALLKLADLTELVAQAAATSTTAPFATPFSVARQTEPIAPSVEAEMTQLLNQAAVLGEMLENAQVSAFASGKLGYVDERAGRYEKAIAHTQAARLAANQDLTAGESQYLWDWQMGRLLSATGRERGAKQAYAQAVASLEKIRSETLSISRDLQFDFRDTVEPIYRRYAALNLDEVPSAVLIKKGMAAFDSIDNTLATIDALKVAELQNYFANDCIIAPVATRVDALDDSQATAVISTAVVSSGSFHSQDNVRDANREQLVAIASLPDGSKKLAQIEADKQTVEDLVFEFRKALEQGRWGDSIADYDQTPGTQLYRWFVQPFEQDLASVKTLVFVNDGLLRSVPMAALYDGKQYLIEKFAVATTPSLTLTNPERIERPARLSALLMGVSKPSEVSSVSFDPLPSVDKELAQVAEILPKNEVLFNEAFSLSALRNTLAEKDYRILHMATHGTFGFDPNDNYVVLGAKRADADGLNEVLTIGELDEIIRETSGPARPPVELLTLTACETAVGDTRSTLGLAGVAVRAGVRSAIATLWSVGDDSSARLISDFYNNFKEPELTKAEALQQAQIAMLRSRGPDYRHPYHWAPFVLIGSWL